MKIKKQNTITRKKVTIIALLLAALLATVYAYFVFYDQQTEKSDRTTTQPITPGRQQAEDLAKKPENKQSSPNTDTTQPPKTTEQTNKAIVQMTASASISGDTVYIRGGIDNAVVSEGSCYAQLSGPGGASISKNTALLQNPSTTDCKTIPVSISDLSKGMWSVRLYYSSNTMEGTSNEASFEIK